MDVYNRATRGYTPIQAGQILSGDPDLPTDTATEVDDRDVTVVNVKADGAHVGVQTDGVWHVSRTVDL